MELSLTFSRGGLPFHSGAPRVQRPGASLPATPQARYSSCSEAESEDEAQRTAAAVPSPFLAVDQRLRQLTSARRFNRTSDRCATARRDHLSNPTRESHLSFGASATAPYPSNPHKICAAGLRPDRARVLGATPGPRPIAAAARRCCFDRASYAAHEQTNIKQVTSRLVRMLMICAEGSDKIGGTVEAAQYA